MSEPLPLPRLRAAAWPTLRRWACAVLLCSAAGAAQAAAEVGQAAPPFNLASAEGVIMGPHQWRGQVVYLDFWASWCGPCRQSFPWMGDLHRRYGPQGLTVVGVNLDTRLADAQAFLKSVPAPFPIVYDAAGKTPRAYAIKAMPTSVLIGRDGRVRQIHAGFRPSDTAALEAAITQALKESAP